MIGCVWRKVTLRTGSWVVNRTLRMTSNGTLPLAALCPQTCAPRSRKQIAIAARPLRRTRKFEYGRSGRLEGCAEQLQQAGTARIRARG